MADPNDIDPEMEEDYDEEADSDFDMSGGDTDNGSASSSDEQEEAADTPARPKKRRKLDHKKPVQKQPEQVTELDSGDEATLKEGRKTRRRQEKKSETVAEDEVDEEGWRAKTRSMRQQEQDDRKQQKLASIKGSTIDVDALWARLNAPDALCLLHRQPNSEQLDDSTTSPSKQKKQDLENEENIPSSTTEETITITRTYNFAGETHTETKTVPKSSAEARLWLQQQASKSGSTAQELDDEGRTIQRPLRKISRFDPNYANIDAFKGQWAATAAGKKATGPKLNVVEKSKMDWASHVDAEGLKEELDVAAKAKGSYLHRTDFLRDVEQRREEEARTARLRGQ